MGEKRIRPEMFNVVIPKRLAADLPARIEAVEKWLLDQPEYAAVGHVGRAFAVRLILLAGLDALDKQFREKNAKK